MSTSPSRICRVKVSLLYMGPPIWRIIEVPETYTFWDLHVAIQDAMGWLDYHLHAFIRLISSRRSVALLPLSPYLGRGPH